MITANVENLFENRKDYTRNKYIVAKAVRGRLWFWGAWDSKSEAEKVASQFDNGVILEYSEDHNPSNENK